MNPSPTQTNNDCAQRNSTETFVVTAASMSLAYHCTKESIATFQITKRYVKDLETQRDSESALSDTEEAADSAERLLIAQAHWKNRIKVEKRQGYTIACCQCAGGMAYGAFSLWGAYIFASCMNNK